MAKRIESALTEFMAGNQRAMSASQKAGWKLFSEELYCTKCHPAPYFTTFEAANNGLYADYNGKTDQGRFRIHHDSTDIGKFKIPSLRNLPLTFPYMHDGRYKNLKEVLNHYGNLHGNSSFYSKELKKLNRLLSAFL